MATAGPTTSPTDLFSVAGKNVVVTGGSRGIGLMIARGFAAAGARLLISSRKADQLEQAASQLRELGPCEAVVADLSTVAGAEALASAAQAWSDRVHVLVNNAGASWGAPLEEFPESGFDKVMATNVKGVFFLTARLLPALRAAASADDPARVINIGSIDGLSVSPFENYVYSASKAAVHMLTRSLAQRLASEHITVNAIAPGPFESKMMAFALDNPDIRRGIEEATPLGRIGHPDDMAGTSIFLASRAGAYLTGAVIPVDGGRTGCA